MNRTSHRSNSSADNRAQEPPEHAAVTRPGWLDALHLLVAAGWPGVEIAAAGIAHVPLERPARLKRLVVEPARHAPPPPRVHGPSPKAPRRRTTNHLCFSPSHRPRLPPWSRPEKNQLANCPPRLPIGTSGSIWQAWQACGKPLSRTTTSIHPKPFWLTAMPQASTIGPTARCWPGCSA